MAKKSIFFKKLRDIFITIFFLQYLKKIVIKKNLKYFIINFHFTTIHTMEYPRAEAFVIFLITINDTPFFEPSEKYLLIKMMSLP